MTKRKKATIGYIYIDGRRFKVLGYGRFKDADFFAYNQKETIYLPYCSRLEKGYRYSKITPRAKVESKSKDEWTFCLKNDAGDEESFHQEWSYVKRDVSPEHLLYTWHGVPMPPQPVPPMNEKYKAWEKVRGKPDLKIDTKKVIDVIKLAYEDLIEFDQGPLLQDLKNGGRLGYILGEITMLVDLQQSDFEEVFNGGYLPCGVISDKRTPTFSIAFERGPESAPIVLEGRVRYVVTPDAIEQRYQGEISKRIGLHSITAQERDSSGSQKNMKDDGAGPNTLEEDGSGEVEAAQSGSSTGQGSNEGIAEKDVSDAASGAKRTIQGMPTVKSKMRYWAFIYACRLSLQEKQNEKADNDEGALFTGHEELIDAAKAELGKMIDKENLELFSLEDATLKTKIREAIEEGHLPPYKPRKSKPND